MINMRNSILIMLYTLVKNANKGINKKLFDCKSTRIFYKCIRITLS